MTLNPALTDWNGLNGLPRFEAVSDGDFAPAFEAALAEHEAEIDAIAASFSGFGIWLGNMPSGSKN